jgi:hypothetical protein
MFAIKLNEALNVKEKEKKKEDDRTSRTRLLHALQNRRLELQRKARRMP